MKKKKIATGRNKGSLNSNANKLDMSVAASSATAKLQSQPLASVHRLTLQSTERRSSLEKY